MSVTGESITISTADGVAEAYLTRPADGGPYPGVLFIVDAFGLRAQTRTMADRIAEWGYIVLVPHLFYRGGSAAELAPDTELRGPGARAAAFAKARPQMAALTADLAREDLSHYVDALRTLPAVDAGPIGVTGYCMGGRLALLAGATRPDDVGAIGMFHAGGLVTDADTSPHRELTGITASILAIHADHDHALPPEAITAFDEALTTAGIPHDTSVYPGAPHGYTMADTDAYHHDAAERHFAALRGHFGSILGPTPTGRLVPGDDGHDLVLTRVLPGSIQDTWASITEPRRTARWIGRWDGTGALGETVRLQLGFEDDSPWTDVTITECDPPHGLRILTLDENGSWDISLELTGAGERTELCFRMHRVDPAAIGEIGPGWEYYLDQLVASVSDVALPNFDDYFPAQREYFEKQTRSRLRRPRQP